MAVRLKKEVLSPLLKMGVALRMMTVRVIPASHAAVAQVKKAVKIRINGKLKRRTLVRKKSIKSKFSRGNLRITTQ